MTKKMAKIREMNNEERRSELKRLKRALMRQRTEKARGGIEETGEIKRLKRRIARILTVIREEQE